MKTSLIIPTLNEVDCIKGLLRLIPKGAVDEILIVDGHSTDGTVELVRELGYPLVFQERKGFGEALMTGIKRTSGDVLVFLTADNSQNPADIPRLLEKIKEGYDFVVASRFLKGSGSEDNTLIRYLGNKFFTFLANLLYGSKFSDILYFLLASKREVFNSLKLESDGFEFCIELPVKVHGAGFKIGEIPSFERKRTSGETKVRTFKDGFKILKAIFKFKCKKRD